jgi:hypothetical protein
MYPTDLTVSAIVADDGRYLLVEEHAMGEVDAVLANADLV